MEQSTANLREEKRHTHKHKKEKKSKKDKTKKKSKKNTRDNESQSSSSESDQHRGKRVCSDSNNVQPNPSTIGARKYGATSRPLLSVPIGTSKSSPLLNVLPGAQLLSDFSRVLKDPGQT